MDVVEFLNQTGVSYTITEHSPVFTAQYVAQAEHEPGRYVAKVVIVKVDGEYMMCVLGACYKIDLQVLKNQLGAKMVKLAGEEEIVSLCSDCDVGAEPPFGSLYKLPTIMDRALEANDHIVFPGGTYDTAIHMNMTDYKKLINPRILEFSYRITY
jgi:Ala-tRNA(Pro) deacylase